MIKYSLDPQLKVSKPEDFLKDLPEIITVNKFNEEAVEKFRTSFNKAVQGPQSIIPIIIDSFGGQVYSLLAIVDVLKTTTKPIATIIQGKAMSCGAILFSMGSEGHRYMGPNATLLIHDVSSFSFGKVEEIKADAKESDRLNQLIYRMMANNVGKPEEYFLDLVHERGHADWFLDVHEAKRHNLANKTYLPTLTIQVSVDIKLA
jgi:ATP-dependent Clp protease protease subunit